MTTDHLTKLLHEKADAELKSEIAWLTNSVSGKKFAFYLGKDVTCNGVTIKSGSYIPAAIIALEMAIIEASRDEYRAKYVEKWLSKVNEAVGVIQELEESKS